jgi:hypothetical protein
LLDSAERSLFYPVETVDEKKQCHDDLEAILRGMGSDIKPESELD